MRGAQSLCAGSIRANHVVTREQARKVRGALGLARGAWHGPFIGL
jgi:hypothetical protein